MAELTGKESALFCLTGTMSNFLAVISQCNPGEEVLVGDISHLGLGSEFCLSAYFVQKSYPGALFCTIPDLTK